MEALTCNVCLERYDMDVHRPKALKCGHSLGLTCLTMWFEVQSKLVCPTCQALSWEKLEEIPDNQSIKDILMGYEMRCPRHGAVQVSAYCVGHMEVVCANCGHTGTEAGCTLKYLIEDEQEIKTKVILEVERRSNDLPEAMTPVIRQAIEKRFKNTIGENIQLLEKIKDLEKSAQVLLCTACQNVADNFIEITTFEAWCARCETYNPDNTNSVQIGGRSNTEIAQLLASKVSALLKKVNFCHLSLDHLIRIERRASLTPKEAQQLGKDLLALEGPKPDFSALPDTFLCSGCKTPQYKSTCNMFILPCTKLHALCEACVGQAGTMSMTCPLDLMTYKRKPEELHRLAAPVSPQKTTVSASGYGPVGPGGYGLAGPEGAAQQLLPELRGMNLGGSISRPEGGMPPAMQPYQQYQQPGMQPYQQYQQPGMQQYQQYQPPAMQQYQQHQPPEMQPYQQGPAMPAPGRLLGPPVFGQPQMHFPPQSANPPPFGYQGGFQANYAAPPVSQPAPTRPANPIPPTIPSTFLAGIALPQPRIDPGLHYLVRFPTVLPEPGPAVTNNKGWFYNFAKNQVEAVTISTFDACRLVALGMANPISPDHMAVVESISLYNGKAATGNPVAVHQGNEQLQGGNQLLIYINLRSPFNIPAFSPVTLKIKLVAPPANPPTIGFDLYRGNPFNRPDTWAGSDGFVWDFEETSRMGEGEMANGQNNLSGPILAFIYQH